MKGLLSSICLAAMSASSAWAQTETPPQDEGGIADIVVTAQRREEAMQDVPIAIAAFNREALETAQVQSTLDLKAVTPGLVITTAAGGFANPRIRGVGTSATGPGVESPVAVYVDGVYMASLNGTLFSMNDVEQVAVLKGPQGTLFGRNATGGLIQVTTRTPTDTPTLNARIRVGNLETAGGDFYVAGPLAPNLTASIAGNYDYQGEGFGRNLATGKDVQEHKNYAGRAKLHWDGGDTRVTLSGDYSKMTGSDPAFRTLGLRAIVGTAPGGGPRDITADFQPDMSITAYGGSLTIRHDFGGVELMSQTAYRKTDYGSDFDLDSTPLPIIWLDLNVSDKQFSQELQLQSVGSSRFQWTVGGIYFWARNAYDPIRTVFPSGRAGTPALPTNASIDTDSVLRLNSFAAFGQGTYELSDATNFTLGLRYTTDKRTINAVKTIRPFNSIIPGSTVDDAKRFSKVTWRASIDHRFSPEVLAYASYNRGFKSGTFEASGTDATRPANGRLVLPETLDAFEVGLKTDLFDRRVRFNLAGFYYDYKNSQVVVVRAGSVQLYNGTGARSYGLDADTTIKVTRDFTINLGGSWLHARYKSFTNAVGTVPITTPGQLCNGVPSPTVGGDCIGLPGSADATGNRLQNTPDLTLSASAVYTIPTSFGDVALAGSYYYNDGYFTEPENRLRQPHYELVDASITWTHPSKNLNLQIWGKNLTDEVYAAQLTANDVGDLRNATPGRTYGVTLGVKF